MLTDLCNLECKHCYVPEPKKGHMSLDNLKLIVKSVSKQYNKKIHDVILSGGEPFIYPYLADATKMFAEKNIPITIYTNGIFAEKNIIKRNDMKLSESKLSYLIHKKLMDILESDFLPSDLIEKFELISKIDGNKVNTITEYVKLNEVIGIINASLIEKEFSNRVNEINFEMQNGNKVIQNISIGNDFWHHRERYRLGVTESIVNSKEMISFLENKLSINITPSHGEIPSYVGKASSFSKFNKFDPIKKQIELKNDSYSIIKYYNMNIGKNPIVTETLESLLKIVYSNNWDIPKDNDANFFVYERLSLCSCLDYPSTISSDALIHNCIYQVLPHSKNMTGVKNEEYITLEKIFKTKGGPMGIARHFGIPENEIYETLMDKGPCGLCSKAMNYNK